MKKALITGITGQDGSYLAEFLLKKGYEVHGVKRRSSLFNTDRVDHLFQDPHVKGVNFFLHFGDVTDSTSILRILKETNPDEIYNLAAQSHVKVSFEIPEYTADTIAMGTLRILESIRILGLENKVKFYQASTSELFGKVQEIPQNELTPFYPCSPYAVAKLYAYWITINYRESYNIFACNGILFNHESPMRGETFVTRKITRGLARIKLNLQECLYLGNIHSKRDWGHARDFVEMQWMMLQAEEPEVYVIATGHQQTVKYFINIAADLLGMTLKWHGEGLNEVAEWRGKIIIKIDPRYFRPTEVDSLLGDSSKARNKLGWNPKISFNDLVREMVTNDFRSAEADALVKKHGFSPKIYHE